MRGRTALACAGAIGLVAAGGSVALAAGETVTTKVSVKKAVKITKKKPGQAKLLWDATIAKPDGSRPANLSGGDLTLPKGTSVDADSRSASGAMSRTTVGMRSRHSDPTTPMPMAPAPMTPTRGGHAGGDGSLIGAGSSRFCVWTTPTSWAALRIACTAGWRSGRRA